MFYQLNQHKCERAHKHELPAREERESQLLNPLLIKLCLKMWLCTGGLTSGFVLHFAAPPAGTEISSAEEGQLAGETY